MAIPLLSRRATPTDDQQDFLRACADLGDERLRDYRLYEDFYNGEQRSRPLARAREYLEAGGVRFAENLIETAIDKAARRFHVSGFQVEDNEDASTWLTQKLWGKMDELQGIVHTMTPMLGDGFVIVTWDAKLARPRWTWNRPHLMKPVYDDDGCLLYVVKKWSTSKRGPQNPRGALVWRMNIYRPDRVEKWFSVDSEGESWEAWRDAPGEAWPMPWTESGALPTEGEADDALGINVIHFRERPKGRTYGRSRVRGMIPYQNQVNKQVLDLFQVMDTQGWQWPWITGLTDTEEISWAVGDILKISSAEAKVGFIPATDPKPMLDAIDATLRRFSLKTDTPLFDIIKGNPPSGEALKTAESGQTSYVKDQCSTLEHSWEAGAALSWRLASLFGGDDVPEYDATEDITAMWDSPETRNELAEAQVAVFLKDIGVSDATLMRRFGLDPEDEAALRKLELPVALPPPPDPATLTR
jgi:hypothetical protein